VETEIDMKNPSSKALFAYWDQVRGDRYAPERAEIDPAAIRHILADTFIAEINAESGTPFRLAGTRMCALFGRELKGTSFRDLWTPDHRREGDGLVATIIDEMAGAVAGLIGTTAGQHQIELELLLLPLRHRGKTHDRLLGSISAVVAPPLLGIDAVHTLDLRSVRVLRMAPGEVHPLGGPSGAMPRDLRRNTFRILQGGRSATTPGSLR
jgi:hypothetical protein